MKSDLLLIEEAAMYTRLSISTIYKLCSRNEILYHKIGRYNMFMKEDLDEFIDRKKVNHRKEIKSKYNLKPIIKL